MNGTAEHRIFRTTLASVYPLYLAKAEKKGRTKAELDATIGWLTGYDESELARLDKLVDELAKGKPLEKVLRG